MSNLENTLKTNTHILLFDGVCNFCDASVQFIMQRDSKKLFRYAAIQSDIGQQLLKHYKLPTDQISTVVLIENDHIWTHSDAGLRVAKQLGGAWPLAYVFWYIPRFIRDAIYRLLARNRYRWFGQKDACRIPTPNERAMFLDAV